MKNWRYAGLLKRKAVFDLFLASALSLYVEMVLIRWVASELRQFAFYKNFALIGAFLGLGLGFALYRVKKRSDIFDRSFLPLILLTVLIVLILGRTGISDFVLVNQSDTQEYIWAGYLEDATIARLLDIAFYIILFVVFFFISASHIPIGTLVASKFQAFMPLQGYTINIIGSLAGILVYSLISFLRWPPATWFLLSGIGAYYFLPTAPRKTRIMNAGMVLLPILLTLIKPLNVEKTLWSPYYRIDLNPVYSKNAEDLLLGYELSVNQAWHQRMWNLDPAFVEAHSQSDQDHFDVRSPEYDAPYEIAPSLENVLIVGAGSGNDVAGALRAGANNITAVEIDPLIVDIGRELHPEHPYSDGENVDLIIEDARSFFRREQDKYDLVVFGLLDSHTLFSSASSVRLDNFVYTKESLAEVRGILEENGLLVLSFGVPSQNEWIGFRLYRILTDVFGHPPQTYETPDGNTIFVIGLSPFEELKFDDPRLAYREDYVYREDIEATTDQWPFLYLRERSLPSTYIIGLIGVILLSIVMTRQVLPKFRTYNAHFFFMGAAFFLLETKSITEIALLLGSTWMVNAVVIAAILCMIVIANVLVDRFELTDARPYYLLLIVSLLFNYFVSLSTFLGLSIVFRLVLASMAQALPLFFAGVIFAISFSQTDSIEIALGSNLIGSILGGIFEYASLILGIRSLYLFAMMFYILSALAWFRVGDRIRSLVHQP
jgi:SAM-dependent methyltransferase